jgi:hypothetical protein
MCAETHQELVVVHRRASGGASPFQTATLMTAGRRSERPRRNTRRLQQRCRRCKFGTAFLAACSACVSVSVCLHASLDNWCGLRDWGLGFLCMHHSTSDAGGAAGTCPRAGMGEGLVLNFDKKSLPESQLGFSS